MGLQDKVVLITGATGGLGSAVVRAYATTGARLALTARSQDTLEKLAREVELPAERTLLYAADLAVAEAARALVAAVAARWGGVDVLPNDSPANRSQTPTADYSRWVKPEEIAAALIYLSSDEAAALNGASIPMYGRM